MSPPNNCLFHYFNFIQVESFLREKDARQVVVAVLAILTAPEFVSCTDYEMKYWPLVESHLLGLLVCSCKKFTAIFIRKSSFVSLIPVELGRKPCNSFIGEFTHHTLIHYFHIIFSQPVLSESPRSFHASLWNLVARLVIPSSENSLITHLFILDILYFHSLF